MKKYRFKVWKVTMNEWEDVKEFMGEYYSVATSLEKAWNNVAHKNHFRPHGNIKYSIKYSIVE